jgi:hypothetical protein
MQIAAELGPRVRRLKEQSPVAQAEASSLKGAQSGCWHRPPQLVDVELADANKAETLGMSLALGTKPCGIPRTPMSSAISAKALGLGSPPAPSMWPVLTLSFASTTMTFWQTRENKHATPWSYVKFVLKGQP